MGDGWFRLRPRSMGELLDDNFRLYREKFSFLMISGLCFLLPFDILSTYISGRYASFDFQSLMKQIQYSAAHPGGSSAMALPHTSMDMVIWEYVLLFISYFLVTPLLYGMVVHMVANRHFEKSDMSLGDASTHSFRRLLPNFATLILLVILYLMCGLVFALLVLFLFHVAKLIAITVSIVLGFAVLCLFLWSTVRLSFVPSVVIEEKMKFWTPIVRSWALTKRNFWRLLGYFILLYIIVGILRIVVIVAIMVFIHNLVLSTIVMSVVDILTVPFFMVGMANMYVDLRIRKDGLDLLETQ